MALIADSYARLLGKHLTQDDQDAPVAALWSAPSVILAHGIEADPVFFFGNLAALRVFETDWDSLTRMPSRLSAQAPDQAERQRLLDRVTRFGFVDDYSGVRISAKGRRFFIPRATVWNLVDEVGVIHGQAATFPAEVQPEGPNNG